ncbi:MAG: MATE family efflux transporter [Lachnospiraceae bacterium]|nr:MATE family efflux transporter [Lachnospiraceae bacterium]
MDTDYINASIGSLYKKLLPSAIGSLLTATVASLIDVLILSHYLGSDMLAVVELCMPIYMLVNTLGMLIASGGSTLYAENLGKNDKEEALKFFTVSLVQAVIIGGILCLSGIVFNKGIVSLLGANEAVFAPTLDYTGVLFFFMIPLMIYVLLLYFVRVDNDPNRVLAATFSCAVVNLVLDVLFVGPFGWGPKGAALATCLAYSAGMIVNLTHFAGKKNTLKITGSLFDPGRAVRVWKAGIPLAVSQLGMTISTNIFNNVIIRAGSEAYVSVYAIVTQLSMTSMAIYDGVGQASQPLIAAAWGAKKHDRIRKVFRYGVILELAGTVFLSVLYIIFARVISGAFSITEAGLLGLSMTGIRIYALSIPFMGLNTIIMYYFQAREKTVRALAISLMSGSLLLIASLLILVALFGVKGIWFSFIMAQVSALVISSVLYLQTSTSILK